MNPSTPRPDPAALLRAALDGEPSAPWQAPALDVLAPLFPELLLHELVGQGGMAAVYRATQLRLDRPVALKVLRPELAAEPQFAERFVREARALAALSSPHVLTIHDFGERGGYCWLVTEFVDGANLRELMRMGRLSPAEVLRLVPQVCAGLHFAHTHGVVHRDLKPENVLVDREGQVKLADFGLAKLAGDPAQPALTRSGVVFGTPHYMAPEQWHGSAGVDHRADIYALGVLLYELLTGRLPVGAFPPASGEPGVPPGVDRVVQRSLQHEPERRYQSAHEVQQDLERQRAGAAAPPPASADAAAAASVGRPLRAAVAVAAVGGFGLLVSTRHAAFVAVWLQIAAQQDAAAARQMHEVHTTVADGKPWTGSLPEPFAPIDTVAWSPAMATFVAVVGGALLLVLYLALASVAWRRSRHEGASRPAHVLAGVLLAAPVLVPLAWALVVYADHLDGGDGLVPFLAVLAIATAVGLLVRGLWRASVRQVPGAPAPVSRRLRAVALGCVMGLLAVAVQSVQALRPVVWQPTARLPVAARLLVGAGRAAVLDRLGPPRAIQAAAAGVMTWSYRGLDGREHADALQFVNGVAALGNPTAVLVPEPRPADGVHAGVPVADLVAALGAATTSTAGATGSELTFADGTKALVSPDGVVVHVGR
jgi:tRNA A-37 threonylcarbamoyl transferase component Bud32